MPDMRDLTLMLKSQTPIIVVETHEESRALNLCRDIAQQMGLPISKWTVTSGLQRLERGFLPQKFNTDPLEVLNHIKSSDAPGLYVLLDFHHHLENAVHKRLIREIAQCIDATRQHLIFLSPEWEMPAELQQISVRFKLSMPDEKKLIDLIRKVALEYQREHAGRKVVADKKAVHLLARNLQGLTATDAERLARKAIWDDGAINQSDLKKVMEAKYKLINQQGLLSFEYDTAAFGDVGGLNNLKQWLHHRKAVFHGGGSQYGLESPKGVMLLGVQGCGKSLAAKAVAGVWGVPLLRLDFASLYNKYMGETERNLRESLQMAEVMAPCVLWVDEIEKGLASGSQDDGVSRRVLGSLLTWMAEREKAVFMVATANDVSSLPPELLRKGRFDELFFVDLPDEEARKVIFSIQLRRRKLNPERFDLNALAQVSQGFSGSEVEQAVVSSLYTAMAVGAPISTKHIYEEIRKTKPLSVLMAEKVEALRSWARDRTVPAN